jgi:hypothetical protein
MTSIKSEQKRVKNEFDARIYEALSAFRAEITERHSGYLREIYESLVEAGFGVSYTQTSLYITQYRKDNGIERAVHKRTKQAAAAATPATATVETVVSEAAELDA